MWARFTNYFIRQLTPKMILNRLFLRRSLDGRLKSIQEHSKILFNIHLLKNIDRVTLPVFKCMAVALWIAVHLFTQKESTEQSLPLQEHIVFVGVLIVIWVLNTQNVVSESWNHE